MTGTITLQMICNTGKPPSQLPKAFNGSTSKFSTHSTGFNDSAWDGQTQEFVKLINKRLRPKSYDNIVTGTQDFAKKTCRAIQTEEIIDLTTDELPDEFAMLIDVPLDDEDIDIQVVNTRGNLENEFDDDNDEGGVLDDNDDKGAVLDNDNESMLKYFSG